MVVKELLEIINDKAPFASAEDFDNVGLIVGEYTQSINGIVVCLDVTAETIEYSHKKECNVIITHHPIIFNAIKTFKNTDFYYSTIKLAIKYDISIIALHTNLDKSIDLSNSVAVLKKLCTKDIALLCEDKYAFCGKLERTFNKVDLLSLIKSRLGDNNARGYMFGTDSIKKVCVVSGAGGRDDNFIIDNYQLFDVFVSSEFKQNIIMLAKEYGINIIESSHYYTEILFIDTLRYYLIDSCHIQIDLFGYDSLISEPRESTENKVIANN